MKVTLHQDAEGKKAGEIVDVPTSRAKWLVSEGYATANKELDAPTAEDDPTVAANAPEPHKSLGEQLENGLGMATEPDPDETVPAPALANPTPIEATNAKGDIEAADKGKAKIEAKVATPEPVAETVVADSK